MLLAMGFERSRLQIHAYAASTRLLMHMYHYALLRLIKFKINIANSFRECLVMNEYRRQLRSTILMSCLNRELL